MSTRFNTWLRRRAAKENTCHESSPHWLSYFLPPARLRSHKPLPTRSSHDSRLSFVGRRPLRRHHPRQHQPQPQTQLLRQRRTQLQLQRLIRRRRRRPIPPPRRSLIQHRHQPQSQHRHQPHSRLQHQLPSRHRLRLQSRLQLQHQHLIQHQHLLPPRTLRLRPLRTLHRPRHPIPCRLRSSLLVASCRSAGARA